MVFSKASVLSSWVSTLVLALLALLTGNNLLWCLAGLLAVLSVLKSGTRLTRSENK